MYEKRKCFFNANITYDQDKQINRIILNTEGNQFTDNYIIVDKKDDFRKWREDDRWFSD